ncbi:S-layer homology domain-containing protein [Halanaerobium sp. ST460_2HS_T2]|uniref:S-layer homology domain-containing protein n=1 Tax=Halanaerobium sp. ST460_2HS_T2 TaxID=2183914 RepID=UPI000DF14AA2|nr:S-layer homology domain-containing protein [Halanaerobium sp. ST460_2HS_T2]RCW50797.1 S-layer family protein [Halanaerobium sp. ST460_2HS_T2]
MKKLTITIALLLVVAFAMPTFAQSFSDVPSDHWAYDAINKLVAAGIVEGYPDGEYKGDQNMTRYEMAVMVSRALDNIVAEQEAMAEEMDAMGEGLTTGQAEDVTAIVKSLMEKNTQDSLTDAQAEEVADIVDALTFELKAELKVLGADVDALGKDMAELEAKVDAMDVPQDKIEFGMDIKTQFEVANYGETDVEKKAALDLLSDGDAIDEDYRPGEDPDKFPSEKAFFQEYDFNMNGALGDAEFNLAVDTITDVFTEEDYPLDLTTSESDSPDFKMDSAYLEVAYENFDFKLGDHGDFAVAPYFNDEEDREGIEMTTSYMDTNIRTFVLGSDASSGDPEDDEEYYGIEVGRDLEFGTLTGKAYHVRDAAVDFLGNASNKNETTILAAQLENLMIVDQFKLGGEVAFSSWDDETNNIDDNDSYMVLNGEYYATDALTLAGKVEVVGENFVGPYNDLEEDNNYNLYNLGAEYVLNKDNTITGAYTLVDYDPGAEEKSTIELGLENVTGKFTNNIGAEFTMNDDYTDDYETTLITLGTEYIWDETLTLGAELANKTKDEAGTDVITYNYLTAFADKGLTENVSWKTEAIFIDGTVGVGFEDVYGNPYTTEEDGQATGLTTSLSVSF